MGPGASIFDRPLARPGDRRGMVWSSVIAILFATFAAISFAVDQKRDGVDSRRSGDRERVRAASFRRPLLALRGIASRLPQ